MDADLKERFPGVNGKYTPKLMWWIYNNNYYKCLNNICMQFNPLCVSTSWAMSENRITIVLTQTKGHALLCHIHHSYKALFGSYKLM